ncbi:MAG: hypothetical protein EOO07_21560 [Chitinophagaceae bacterium]|nr:MAG: hypothetical protein EOO07_21560 [Chitinophagaceae bacterium]
MRNKKGGVNYQLFAMAHLIPPTSNNTRRELADLEQYRPKCSFLFSLQAGIDVVGEKVKFLSEPKVSNSIIVEI